MSGTNDIGRAVPGRGGTALKSDLLLAVTQLAAERSLPARVVVSAVQDALTAAYKRDQLSGGEDVEVVVDPGHVEVRGAVEPLEERLDLVLQVLLQPEVHAEIEERVGNVLQTSPVLLAHCLPG